MRKVLKVMIILELIILAASLLFYAFEHDGPWDSLVFAFPAIGLGLIILILLLYSFASSLRSSASRNITMLRLFVNIIALPGVPLLGLWYSTSGDNRESLKIVSTIALGLGVVALVFMIARNLKLK